MKIESDSARIISGVRQGKTLGSPIALLIENRDWQNWKEPMSVEETGRREEPLTRPRPGHADLPGALKFAERDIRNILERSSARETAMRVALGAVARKLLSVFGISIGGFVTGIGRAEAPLMIEAWASEKTLAAVLKKAEKSDLRCPDEKAAKKMRREIDKAIREGDSLGGVFTIFATGVPPGLGSHASWDERLDGTLARALMSVPAIKAVEIGGGLVLSRFPGSRVMDEIFYKKGRGFFRKTNFMGGIEGGMTNGMPVIVQASMKPIPTLRKPLRSVDIRTKRPVRAAYERADACAVPAASVVGEAMAALTLASAFLQKFGGDSVPETRRNHDAYKKYLSLF
jgi:chorismate synthase